MLGLNLKKIVVESTERDLFSSLINIADSIFPVLLDDLILSKLCKLSKKVVRIDNCSLAALHLTVRKVDHSI